MSGVFTRSGVFTSRSILGHLLAYKQPPFLASRHLASRHCRAYARVPILLVKSLKKPALGSFSSASSSSSSSSAAVASASFSVGNGVIGWYLGMIKAHPVLTKSVTCASIYTAADVSSQGITLTSSESFDLLRTFRMAGYGMLVVGPSLHFWFNFISRVLPKRDTLTTLKKIFVGQVTYGPIMTAVFFSLNAGLQGESGSEIIARLKRDMFPTLRNGLLYWPMCDFVTFKFVPVHLQPLVSNTFSYLWTIYITYMASLDKVSSADISAD